MSKYIVYGLIDPRTGELRYVGKTGRKLAVRFQQHLQPAYLRPNTPKNAWIKSLKKQGLKPEIDIIEETEDRDSESFWISYYKSIGCNLTNATSGGEGWQVGTKHSEVARQKISLALTGAKRGPSPFKGKKLSEETRRKMSEAASKRVVSDETRLKHSKVRKIVVDQFGNKYLTTEEAARKIGVHSYLVGLVLKGKKSEVKGYRFSYLG